MKIEKLELKNYRNIKELIITPSDNINVIYGDNAQGKTNIIEAISMFSGNRSFRSGKDSELIRFGEKIAFSKLSFEKGGTETEITISVSEKNKVIKKNEKIIKSSASLSDGFFCAVFSPNHLSLIKGGPAERRNYLDGIICQIKPQYYSALLSYNKTLIQRNALLKDIKSCPDLLDTLDFWDENLIKLGVYITKVRINFLKLLAPVSKEIYKGISDFKEEIDFSYYSSVFSDEVDFYCDEPRAAEIYRKKLKARRADDLTACTTGIGIHRDDLIVNIGGMSARSFGSQGQQRSAVLALLLGFCDMFYKIKCEKPVILLDDVMSELDSKRRDYILNHVADSQVFITCCSDSLFSSLLSGKIFLLKNGEIIEEKNINSR